MGVVFLNTFDLLKRVEYPAQVDFKQIILKYRFFLNIDFFIDSKTHYVKQLALLIRYFIMASFLVFTKHILSTQY